MKLTTLFVCLLVFTLALTACGSGSNPITVSLSPGAAQSAVAGQTVAISATVANDSKTAGVSWSLTGPGALSGQTATSVTYTAPSPISAAATATITATSVSDSTKVATVTINLQAVSITLTPSAAQTLDQGQTVSITAAVTGDPQTKGVTWSVSGGGALSGQTATAVTYTAPPSITSPSAATVTATSAFDSSKTSTLTINLLVPPSITTTSPLASAQVGVAYSASLAGANGATPYTWSVSAGTLPPGLTLSGSTISGTPTATGTSSFTVQLRDATGFTVTKTLSITVNQAPAITSANSTAFPVNTAGTFSVTATGAPTPTLSESGTLPSGITFVDNGNGTATLAGTATATGNFPITITASNGIGTAATQSFTLTISQVAAISSGNSTTFVVGTAGTFSVTTTGFPKPSLAESGALPTGVTFKDNGDGTGTLAGTAAASKGGIYTLTITAHNGVGSDATQTFTLTVNEAPTITSANSTTFPLNANGTFNVTTNGYPKPALAESGALPNGVTFTDNGNGTGTLSGIATAIGTFQISFTASNGIGANATQSFTLTVNTAPGITSNSATTFTVGTAGTFTITTTGSPTPTITETGALPSGVTFTDNGNGTATLAGTPAVGSGNAYSLTITAHNGVPNDAKQTFTLTVNEAPAITSPNSATFTVGQSGSLTITTNGYPKPSLTETGGSGLPNGVSFHDNGNGTATLSGTPAPGSNSSYTFTISANNGIGSAATQSFTLTVNPAAALVVSPANNSSLPSGTVNASYNTVISATGGIQPYTFTLDASTTALPAGLSLTQSNPGASNNTGVIAGTPTATGTTSGIIVDVTDSNVPPTTIKVTYSLQVNSAGSQVSGNISLNNQCGGGGSVTVPPITVSINTTPVQTTSTDSSGNYSFATVPNGTYTITPSITGASSVFYPATLTGVVVNNNPVSGENFNATLGYTVSGTVAYGGTTTGRTYLNLSSSNCGGNQGQAGTSIAAPGAFTIHGVPPGSYTLQAWMDPSTLAQGSPNAADPTGSVAVTVTNANATGANVTLVDPTLTAPTTAPTIKAVLPFSQGVFVSFGGGSVTNSNGVEEFSSYLVQWSTSTSGFSNSNQAQFKAIGRNSNVWILTNGMSGLSGSFTSGTAYYVRVAGKNSAGTGPFTYWGGAGNSCNITTCAVTVTVTPPSGFTVSGTVTIPSDITPTGPLYVGFYDQNTNSAYGTKIASPSNSSPNSYSVQVPSGNNYFFFGILDQNNDGLIDAGDVSNTNAHNSNSISITSNMTGVNETLPDANSLATVNTQFNQYTSQNGSGSQTSTNYNLSFDVREQNKLPVAVQLASATNPNVITPVDISNLCGGCGTPQFDYYTGIGSDVPVVNDSYTFAVTYSDGTSANVTGKVTAVLGTSQLVTSMAPQGTSSTSTTPTFTWTYPANASSYTYQFYICCSSTGTIWQVPSQNSNSNGFTNTQIPGSLTWGVDPTNSNNLPTVNSLSPGTQYNWQIQTQDANGNSASNSVWYQP